MTLITDVFLKLRTRKNIVRLMPKKSLFRRSVENQHGKCPQTMFKFEGQPVYHIIWSLGSRLSYEKSLLVIWKISKLFINKVSADGKYSLWIETIQRNEFRWIYLEKKKLFFQFCSSFLKSNFNLDHFQKKHDPHNWSISEITDSQKHG